MPCKQELPAQLLIDAHVHYHACFDRRRFFDSAWRNLERASQHLSCPGLFLGCLLFTESAADHYFREFQGEAGAPSKNGWSFHRTSEDCSLFAKDHRGETLLLVAGRQIVTAENLEVLAIGTPQVFTDGRAIRDVVREVSEAGAVGIVPWGFGKWWLRRGRIVRDLIENPPTVGIFLGDNAGRLRLSPRPKAFHRAESRGIFVLPGSDPLPFPSATDGAGRYGFRLEAELDSARPAATLKEALGQLASPPAIFGERESLPGFCRSQIAMQLRKRLPRSPS